MIKKLLFFSLLTVFSGSVLCSEIKIRHANQKQEVLNHIAREKMEITRYLQRNLFCCKKAKLMVKASLKESYFSLKMSVEEVLTKVVFSAEFSDSINQIIDYQLECIVDKQIKFNDITCDFSRYSVEKKIEQELALMFPELNTDIQSVFNIFYLKFVSSYGCYVLLEKLTLKEEELTSFVLENKADSVL